MCLLNRKEAQPTVQVSREITTTNGCRVTLTFAEKEDPNLQHGSQYHSAGGCTSNICCKMFIATLYNKNGDKNTPPS